MKIFDFKTVDSLPCLYLRETDLLVVSDLHLGLEESLTKDGNYVPRHQIEQIKQDIEKARDETGASRILVNGDIKNEFATSRYSETREIKDFFRMLENDFEEVILIKGNHDNFVEGALDGFSVSPEDHYIENGILFTHGHTSIEELEVNQDFSTVVIGHEHPALALEDEIGIREKVDCFLYGENESGLQIVVLPAFSPISNGTAVNETPRHELLSPLLRENGAGGMKAVAVSREAGVFEFPEIRKF
ncbi:MAG: metallophosphoesterase [Candidatus Nanohaloarchaea archaeon]